MFREGKMLEEVSDGWTRAGAGIRDADFFSGLETNNNEQWLP